MGDAAAVPDHDRGRAPPPPPSQGLDRARPRSADLNPSDWLDLFTRIGAGVRRVVTPLVGTEAGRVRHETGAGGDTTLEVDRAAEAAVFAELTALAERGERFSVLSEEAGQRSFGSDFPLILVDPVDGSLNAEHGIPVFGLMLAMLDGPNVDDTRAGLVLNLSTGESWTAIRGDGGRRDGRPVRVLERDGTRIELLGLESTPRALTLAQPLVERSTKIRILGSMALSLAHTAAGGFDVFCAPIPIRLFDTAASLLIVSEAGGVATDLEGEPVGTRPCTLQSRSSLLCAPTASLHDAALRLLRGGS